MKLSLVYDPTEVKLRELGYSQAYRDQWKALVAHFDEVQHITESCSADDLDGDVIIFYDPHSTHDITIDNISRHKSVKYTYLDDPHQYTIKGRHLKTGQIVRKIGGRERIERELERCVDYIICPYTESYYRHFKEFLDGRLESMHVWFPVSSDISRYSSSPPLVKRKHEVLANGALKHLPYFYGYEFRKWAFKQPEVTFVPHCKNDPSTQRGLEYPGLLRQYAGVLALCDEMVVPKYLEIPMAGCVCFAQYQRDYMAKMGFKDRIHCIYVNKVSFHDLIEEFKADVAAYQHIADAGRKLVEENWTARHFAEHIYKHAEGVINGSN
jgi:hypothetical protein